MFISIFKRDIVDEEVEEEVGGIEDTMVAQEDVYSTIQHTFKVTKHLMYTFIQRRHHM